MTLPLAVAPSVKTPGLALLVDLLAGNVSPGSQPLRCLMIAQKDGGSAVADTTLYEAVAGADAVEDLLGAGAPGHLAAKALFAENGLAQVDLVVPVAASGVEANGTIAFSGTVTDAHTCEFWVAGRKMTFSWNVGDSATVAGDKCVAEIQKLTRDLPVTAANVTGTVTLTAKSAGTWGNEIRVRAKLVGGAGGTVTPPATGKLTNGTTEFNVANVLDIITATEYSHILLVTSVADIDDGTSTSNPGKLRTYVNGADSGFSAKLQQVVMGSNGTIAGAKAGADALNHGPTQIVLAQNAESLGFEFAGAEVGARLRDEAIDPAVNRIEKDYEATLYLPANRQADELTEVEIEDLLGNGVTPITYTSAGIARPKRPVTTYHTDDDSNPDDRLLDTSRVSGTYAVARDLRQAIPLEYPQKKLSEDLNFGDEPPPPNVIEVREIKAFVNQRIRFWVRQGVVISDKWDEAVANGSFIVRVNPTDASQCDLVVPIGIVPPLAKFSLAVLHTGPN